MPLKFNDAIEVLLQKLPRASDNIKPEYIEYADQISKKIYQALEDINSIFKGTITGLNHACLINHTCPEFWCYNIDINMPFNVEPEENGIITIGSMAFFEYKLKTFTNYPAVQNGYMSTQRLSTLLDFDLKRAVEKIQKFKGKEKYFSSALRELILSSKDTGRLKYIYGKLLQFKKSDSVEMKELMELFGQT